MSGLRRFNLENHCYHVTSATRGRTPTFEDPANAKAVIDSLAFIRERDWAYVLAYCVMPDHVHLLLVPRNERTLSQVMQSIKGFVSRKINARDDAHGPIWQQSFYDRAIREEKQLETALNYIHFNPVRAGLVALPGEYRFSSAFPGATTDVEAWSSD